MSTNQNYGPPNVSGQIQEVEYSGPNAICVENPAGTFTNGFYREVYRFTKGEGAPFSLETTTREYTINGTTWAQTVPVGTIRAGACVPVTVPNEVDRIATTEEGCAAGTGWTRRTNTPVNNATGALATQTISYINAAGTVQAAAPTGFTLGDCPLVPATFTTTVTDLLAGQTQTIAAAPNLVSWSVRNRTSTTGTFRVNGGTILPFDITEVVESGEINAGNYAAACEGYLKYKFVAKRDCSVRSNGCYGVWTRAQKRFNDCKAAH